MDEKQKKILLITLSGLVVIAFILYELNKGRVNEDPWQDFTNPETLDDRPSKSSIQTEKKKREHQKFDFDRKVTRLEDFLSRQIIKDPFNDSVSEQPSDTSEVQVVVTYDSNKMENPDFGLSGASSNTEQPTTTNSPNLTEEDVLYEQPRRKTGFASGGIELQVKQTEEAISKTKVLAVIHENTQIKNGSKIKLRIIDSFIVGHVTVPMNSFTIGHVRLSDDHVYVDVNSIAVNGARPLGR